MADLLSTNVFGTLTSSGIATMQSNVGIAGTLTVSGSANIASLSVPGPIFGGNVSVYSGVTKSSNVQMLSDGRVTEWSHLRGGNFLDTPENSNGGVFAKPDGTIIYNVGQSLDNVYQYSLSTAWNVATGTLSQFFNVSGPEGTPVDLFFKSDGSTLYILGDAGNDITYWSLSESWNVGSTLTLGGTYSVSAQTSSPKGLHFSGDGTKFWVASATAIFQYTVATPWTLTTATYDNKTFNQTQEGAAGSISLNPSGTIMLLLGSGTDSIYEYYLSTANDITTASYTGRFRDASRRASGGGGETTPTGMFVAYPNNRMYLVGSLSTSIIEYKTDNGLTIDTDTLSVEGGAIVADSLFVGEDLKVRDSVIIENQLTVGGIVSFSGTSFTQSAGDGNYGGSTGATPTYKLGFGAMPSGTKTIEVGTNATGGSTNITIGTPLANSTLIVYANTATFSNVVNIQRQLVVSGLNILDELAVADNTARVSANSGSILSNKSLNFVNTATVTVSVTDSGAGNANISFSSSGGSGVTSVATGLGLSGGTITSTGTISANIANTSIQGVTKLIDVVTSTDSANAATANSVKVTFDQATLAYGKANTAHDTAVVAYGQANAAYSAANVGVNKTQVSANGNSTQSNVAINFVNTSTILVSVGPGTTGNANVSFSTVAKTRTIGIVVDGGGSVLTTGTKGYTEVAFSGTITEWKIIADQSGSCVFDIWKTNAAIPTNANSITAAAKPTLTAAQRATSTTLTSWTTSVTTNDTFGFEIESASTITRAVLILVIREG